MPQDEHAPLRLRTNWYYLGPVSATLAATAVYGTWYMARQGASAQWRGQGGLLVVLVIWVAIWLGIGITVVRQVGTSVSIDGIRQRGLIGVKSIRWRDVVRVTGKMGGLKVESRDQWITFIPEFFRNGGSIEPFVRRQVRAQAGSTEDR